jgi:hypothetical protein
MDIQSILYVLNQGWVGILVGAVISLFTYLKTRTFARLSCRWRGIRLIGGDNPALPAEVPRLASSTIVIWNTGTTTLRGRDIGPMDPLCLKLSEGEEFLEAEVIKRTRDVTKFQVWIDPGEIHQADISFDFLAPGDGGTIKVLHTGAKAVPQVSGTIRRLPKGVKDWGKMPTTGELGIGNYVPLLAILGASIVTLWPHITFGDIRRLGPLLLLGVITFLILALIYLPERRKFPKALMPEDLK